MYKIIMTDRSSMSSTICYIMVGGRPSRRRYYMERGPDDQLFIHDVARRFRQKRYG